MPRSPEGSVIPVLWVGRFGEAGPKYPQIICRDTQKVIQKLELYISHQIRSYCCVSRWCEIWIMHILQLFQATKFGDNDRAVTLSFSYLLNKVADLSLPYFHYFFRTFYYCSCLISVLVFMQNYSSLLPKTLVGRYPKHWSLPLYGQSLPFQWNEITDDLFVITLTDNKSNKNLLSL